MIECMRTRLLVPALFAMLCIRAPGLQSAPKEEPLLTAEELEQMEESGGDWKRWAVHDPDSTVQVDTSAWTGFVREFSDNSSRGALDFLHIARRGYGFISQFVFQLQEVPVSRLNRDEQLAYWLNLHNAAAVRQTAVKFPFKDESTRELVLGDAWRADIFTVEDQKLSLEDIERRILFRQWPDARVIYGVYLPASGAPPLSDQPFTGAEVWRQLEARGRAYVNRGPALELAGEELHVSALYYWDKALFADDAALIAHLRKYAEPPLAQKLAGITAVRASWLNWRLNSFNSGYDINQDRSGGGGAS